MATALTLVLLTILSIDPEAELLCPAIGIDLHNCRPIVGPIAYSIGYYPGYKKELMAHKQVAPKYCRFELRTTLLLRPSTLSFLRHNKDIQRRIRGFFAGLEGRAAWMMTGELPGS